MYIGFGLAFVILLPYPRIIRRPIVHLFEVILTNKYLTYLEFALLLLCGVVCGISFQEHKKYGILLVQQKSQFEVIEGLSRVEMEKTIYQTRMNQFYEQRNIYIAGIDLVLFFFIFTYLYSIKRYDQLNDRLEQLEKAEKQAQNKNTPPQGQVK